MEEQLVRRLIQIGIRSMNAPQRKQAHRFGVETVEMRSGSHPIELHLSGGSETP